MKVSMAAQYIRMSTDKQNLSPAIQREAIATYAAVHGLEIVATYVDDARSGLLIANREAMKKLIWDVTQQDCAFGTVLVYDISRWGRFQNTDASAYYDYHCRLNGVRVIYVAEALGNDSSPLSSVVRNMKRVMAAEYSRELAQKSSAGQVRVLALGFQMGSLPCVGFRRQAVSDDGAKLRVLERGERKPRENDRVQWILGPDNEVRLVRQIFAEYALNGVSLRSLVRKLRATDCRSHDGRPFTAAMVAFLLDCEAVIGNFLWGRPKQTGRGVLEPRLVPLRAERVVPAIVDAETWRLVQDKRLAWTSRRRTNAQLIEELRRALHNVPNLTPHDLQANGCASVSAYKRTFGSFAAAVLQAGGDPTVVRESALHRYAQRGRSSFRFMSDLQGLLIAHGVRAHAHGRLRLLVVNGCVEFRVRFVWQVQKGHRTVWSIGQHNPSPPSHYILLVRMNSDRESALDFLIIPPELFPESLPRHLTAEIPSKLSIYQLRSGDELVEMIQMLGHRQAAL